MRIGRAKNMCAGCGRPLPDQNGDWFSGLTVSSDGYIRHDFCGECIFRFREGLFCWWRRRKRRSKPLFDKEGALLFFEELNSRGEDEHTLCAMALVLLRRRLLKLVEIRVVGDKRVMVLRSKRREFAVPSVPLEDAKLTELREKLGALFEER